MNTRPDAVGAPFVLVIAVLAALGVAGAVLSAAGAGVGPAAIVLGLAVLILVPLFVTLDRHRTEAVGSAQPTDHWADQEPFGRPLAIQRTDPRTGALRETPRPPPNPRHMVVAGWLFLAGALLIVVVIATGDDGLGRALSGAVLALIFVFVGALLLHVGTVRSRWRRARGIPLDLEP